MINKLKKLTRSKLVRNIAIVATGTAGAQAIVMAFSPVITRLYGPEAFGLLGAFMAILAIVTPIAALTYPVAIVLPRSDADAKGLAKLSGGLAVGMACLIAVIFLIAGDRLVDLLGLQAIDVFLLLIPLAMMFSAFQQILQQWLIREKKFRITAKAAVMHSIIICTMQAGIGLFYPISTVLIILATISNGLYAALFWLGIKNQIKINITTQQTVIEKESDLSFFGIWALAKRYQDFPIYRAPQDIINAFSQGLPILMLASFFGPAAAGFYTLAKAVMGAPSTLIGKSVGDVFYPRITKAAQDRENLFQLILKATLALTAIGFAPFTLVVAFGPWLFSLIFGAEWITAGEYARWLALFFLFNFINKPSVAAVPVLGIQKGLLFYEIFSTGAKTLGFFAGLYWFDSAIWAVALFSVIGVFAYITMILWVLWCSLRWNDNAKTS